MKKKVLLAGILSLSVLSGLSVKAQNTDSTNTSTTTTEAVKEEKKLKYALTGWFTAQRTDVYKNSIPLNSSNYLGVTYKMNNGDSLNVRQYFSYVAGQKFAESEDNPNGLKLSNQLVSLTRMLEPIGKSEKIPFQLGYVVPTSSEVNNEKSLGILYVYSGIDYALNPSVTAGYMLNPNLLMSNVNHAMTILIQGGTLSYTINDNSDTYVFVGHQINWNKAAFADTASESALFNVGANLKAGSVKLNPEVANAIKLKGKGKFEQAALLRDDETKLNLTATVAF